MKKSSLTTVLIVSVLYLLLDNSYLATAQETDSYCFKYRWTVPIFNSDDPKNCTWFYGAPCIDPLVPTDDMQPPDTRKFWEDREKDEKENNQKLCVLTPGNVCLKYTFFYDGAIVNISSYCGKMIEDQKKAVTSGCYESYVDGYVIEACACQSIKGAVPCNSSTTATYSAILMIISLSFISMNFMRQRFDSRVVKYN